MKFPSFEQYRKSYPEEAALMEDSEAPSFVKEMRKKVETNEDLTPKMRSALQKIISERKIGSDVVIPEVGRRVAMTVCVFQKKTETDKFDKERCMYEFRTDFGVRGRIQNELSRFDELMEESGVTDEAGIGEVWIAITGELAWKRGTFLIVSDIEDWDAGDENSAPPRPGIIRKIGPGESMHTVPSPGTESKTAIKRDRNKMHKESEEQKEIRRKRSERPQPRNEIERLRQQAEDVSADWRKALKIQ